MSSNFYKIEKEIHIDDIFEKNSHKLIVLLFSFEDSSNNNDLNETFKLKKYIKNNLNTDNNTIYLYINLKKYLIKENKFSKYITKESLPYLSFYYNFNLIARILNCEQEVFINTLAKLKEHIASAKNNNQSNDQTNETQSNTPTNKPNSNDISNDNDQANEQNIEQNNLTEQIRQQRKIEEIEKLKQQYLINELTKLKKAKEIQEQLEEHK
jgi:hypothetical protein